jgi:hypothetical protein
MAVTKEQMDKMQESLDKLLQLNTSLADKVDKLEAENQKIREDAVDRVTKIKAIKDQWKKLDEEAVRSIDEMTTVRDRLQNEGVKDQFFEENTNVGTAAHELLENIMDSDAMKGKKVMKLEPVSSGDPFANTGREERIDASFGLDGDCSAVSLRRFIERYRVVRELNMKSRLTGWDSPKFRSGKLKLCMVGDPFDYISFESSMLHGWTDNDEEIIEKLMDKFMNLQAIELNMLTFEKAEQEGKESLGEYLMRLRRLVKEAYDGDSQSELDRKVAWKFVSGIQDRQIKKKLLENGWMKDRRSAKPLEELLRLAEVTKQTDDAVEVMDKHNGAGSVNMFSEDTKIAAFNRFSSDRRTAGRVKSSSGESKNSTDSRSSDRSYSSGLALEFIECWYCKKKHRGGWFYCSQRKREEPEWRPKRKGHNVSGTKGDFRR